mmetsp:Transcript_5595/g.12273  ORF Transcript_5595/g.12273 Transcript_5595/m.12273 type:complete len:582 (-) Transcript_5595:856-2601(-)
MSNPNRPPQKSHGQPQTHQNYGHSSYGNGGAAALDYSERTPSSQGAQSQYGGSHSQYSGVRGIDYSDRTPYSEGGYTRGGYAQRGYAQGGYTQGGYSQDGYSQDGYTNSNNSDRTPYSSGGYAPMNNSDRTPYSSGNYADVNNSDRTPYSNGVYTERSGISNNSVGASYSNGNRGDSHYDGGGNYGPGYPSRPRAANHYSVSDMSSVDSARRRRASNDSMSQLSNSFSRMPPGDNSSHTHTVSTGATTVADGGRGRCPYQVEFRVHNQGKQVSSTKRIIYFRYGFANEKALSQGATGTECRGKEHDIVITWSITGGKRAISMDGREIQYSAGKRANASRRADILEASWRMSDHTYELRCYAYKPAAGSPEKRNPRWKQYSLIIDGREYFELPQIFDLGWKGLRPIMQPPPVTDSQANSSLSSLSVSQTLNQPHPKQVKGAIQARIDQQRKLLKARNQAVTNEKNENRFEHEKAKKETLLGSDLQSTGIESMGVESSGVESTGVLSAAPSELDAAKKPRRPESYCADSTGTRCTTEYFHSCEAIDSAHWYTWKSIRWNARPPDAAATSDTGTTKPEPANCSD